ncbi:MAG: hypothetical protein V2J14_09810 [Erythrobacter sp.]|jgi:hypothetical protein|nr:hypothetical protein [Erythrobacter sp.]
MITLPNFVRRLPFVFYALAIFLGGWRFLNEWYVASASMQFAPGGDEFDRIRLMARSNALYWGISEAAYLLSSGAMLHVLIAIHDKMKGPEA